MRNLRVFLAGQKFFGQEVMRALLSMEGITVVGVSAPAPGLSSAGEDRLWRLAVREGFCPVPSGRLFASSLPDGIDVIVAAHCHDFISAKARARTALGAIGYHPSLLPLHRGRDALYWTIRMHDHVAGGTVFWLTDDVDSGPIAARKSVFVRPGDTPFELWRRDLQPLGVGLIRKVLLDLQAGLLFAHPQEDGVATWEPSVGRPPLWRPDLPLIGTGPEGFQVITSRKGPDDV